MKGKIYFSDQLYLRFKDTMRKVSENVRDSNWIETWSHETSGKSAYYRPVRFQEITIQVFQNPWNDQSFLEEIPDEFVALKHLCKSMSDWRIKKSSWSKPLNKPPSLDTQLTHMFHHKEISDRKFIQGIGTRQQLPDLFLKWLLGVTLDEFEAAGTVQGLKFEEVVIPLEGKLKYAATPSEGGDSSSNGAKKDHSGLAVDVPWFKKIGPSPWLGVGAIGLGVIALIVLVSNAFNSNPDITTIIQGDNNGTVMQESSISHSDADGKDTSKEQLPIQENRDNAFPPPSEEKVFLTSAFGHGEEEENSSSRISRVIGGSPTISGPASDSTASDFEPLPPKTTPVYQSPLHISFQVLSKSGAPVTGAKVFLEGASPESTDESGNVSFSFDRKLVDRSVPVRVIPPDGKTRTEYFVLSDNHHYEIRLF